MKARSRQGQGLCKARGEEDSGQAFPAQAAAQGSSGVGRCAWGSCDPPPPPLTSCGTTASFTLSLSFPVCKPAFPGGGGGRVHPSAGRELGSSLVLKEPCLPAPGGSLQEGPPWSSESGWESPAPGPGAVPMLREGAWLPKVRPGEKRGQAVTLSCGSEQPCGWRQARPILLNTKPHPHQDLQCGGAPATG